MIEIDYNKLTINDNVYFATNGLLELLLKKSPNFSLYSDDDIEFYKQILDDSKSIYQVFYSSKKRLNTKSGNIHEKVKVWEDRE